MCHHWGIWGNRSFQQRDPRLWYIPALLEYCGAENKVRLPSEPGYQRSLVSPCNVASPCIHIHPHKFTRPLHTTTSVVGTTLLHLHKCTRSGRRSIRSKLVGFHLYCIVVYGSKDSAGRRAAFGLGSVAMLTRSYSIQPKYSRSKTSNPFSCYSWTFPTSGAEVRCIKARSKPAEADRSYVSVCFCLANPCFQFFRTLSTVNSCLLEFRTIKLFSSIWFAVPW